MGPAIPRSGSCVTYVRNPSDGTVRHFGCVRGLGCILREFVPVKGASFQIELSEATGWDPSLERWSLPVADEAQFIHAPVLLPTETKKMRILI